MIRLPCFALLAAPFVGCAAPEHRPEVSRSRERADLHFEAGWSHIMNEGRWTAAEASFRAAAEADPEWVLARSLVARITADVVEREALLEWIEARIDDVGEPDRLLLEVFVRNIVAMNARDRGRDLPAGFRAERQEIARRNFSRYVEQRPEAWWASAEWVEWIHSAEGAEAALSAIDERVDRSVVDAPFFVSYRTVLLAELGRYAEAEGAALAFEASLQDPGAPAVHVLRAQLALAEGRAGVALVGLERALEIDPAHLIARGLAQRVRARGGTGD